MTTHLAEEILKTLPEPWIDDGIKLSDRYAAQLKMNGLIERVNGGYRLSEKGFLFLRGQMRNKILFTPGTSKEIEEYYQFRF